MVPYSKPLKTFWQYIDERSAIFVAKSLGMPKPWTQDQILQDWKFCNTIRDLDKSSEWFIQNMRDPHSLIKSQVLFDTILFRWFNIPETGETIVQSGLNKTYNWDKQKLADLIRQQPKKFSAAYRTKAPKGDKIDQTLAIIDDFHAKMHRDHLPALHRTTTCQEAFDYLTTIPYFGEFNTYQFMLDLMQTSWADQWSDVETWCIVGPGGRRGLEWIHGREVNGKTHQHQAQVECHLLWTKRPDHLLDYWVSDIQHNLCEWDKYNRVLNGGRMKAKYPGS